MKISVTILTKNSEKHLTDVLNALILFEEVIVCDTGSSDQTFAIAKRYPNVKLFKEPFQGFGKTHNIASAHASNDWILSIDSDEIATPELLSEIQNLSLDPNAIYSIPRKNLYRGKHIRGCGWAPDRVIRLYHRQHAHFCNSEVHEKVIGKNVKQLYISAPLIHKPYESIEDFLSKMQLYTSLFAKQNIHKRKGGLLKGLGHGLFTFLKSFFLKKGFLDGKEGVIISLYNAHTAYYKYLKLKELQN